MISAPPSPKLGASQRWSNTMSALSIVVLCERLCKGVPVRIPAMSAVELADFLDVLAFVKAAKNG